MHINRLLDSLLDLMAVERPNVSDILNNGIESIPDSLELPEDIKSIYKWRNGTNREKIIALGSAYVDPPYYLLSVEDGVRLIAECESFCPIIGKWFPIMTDDAGVMLYINCGETASRPRIMMWDRSLGGELIPIYDCVESMLKTIIDGYQNRVFEIEDDIIFLKEHARIAWAYNPGCTYWQTILNQFE